VLAERDRAAVCRFLDARLEPSMFLRSNLERAGFDDDGSPLHGTYVGAFEADELVALGAHFSSSFINLQCPSHVSELVRCLVRASGRSVRGLLGPWSQLIEACAALGLDPERRVAGGRDVLYRLPLDQLLVPELLRTGLVSCRRAVIEDVPVLAEQCFEYTVELLGAPRSEETRRGALWQAESGAADESLYVLIRDGRLVAKSHFNARFADLVQIGGVWVPPALRGQGLARSGRRAGVRELEHRLVAQAPVVVESSGVVDRSHLAVAESLVLVGHVEDRMSEAAHRPRLQKAPERKTVLPRGDGPAGAVNAQLDAERLRDLRALVPHRDSDQSHDDGVSCGSGHRSQSNQVSGGGM
jgi:uncharacterized protein